jgi:hypothetical protein
MSEAAERMSNWETRRDLTPAISFKINRSKDYLQYIFYHGNDNGFIHDKSFMLDGNETSLTLFYSDVISYI